MHDDVLNQIDATLNGRCACGCGGELRPNSNSAYFADVGCQHRWNQAQATDPYQVYNRDDQGWATNTMRWRPELVIAADDHGLTPLGSHTWYTGQFNAQLFERDGTDSWHLRLDDGHRYVGTDLAEIGDTINDDLMHRVKKVWRRLERDLTNPGRISDDPSEPTPVGAIAHAVLSLLRGGRTDVMGHPWKRWCAQCCGYVQPLDGLMANMPPMSILDAPDTVMVQVEIVPCQVCVGCVEPMPGPVLISNVTVSDDGTRWTLRLGAHHGGRRYGWKALVCTEEINRSADPARAVQMMWDHCERNLLRRINEDTAASDQGTAMVAPMGVGRTTGDGLTFTPGAPGRVAAPRLTWDPVTAMGPQGPVVSPETRNGIAAIMSGFGASIAAFVAEVSAMLRPLTDMIEEPQQRPRAPHTGPSPPRLDGRGRHGGRR